MALEAPRYDVTLYAGATFQVTLQVTDDSDVARDLTGYTATLKARPNPNSGTVLFTWTSSDYITITAATGTLAISVPANVTTNYASYAEKPVAYDIATVSPTGAEEIILRGQMQVEKRISR